MSQASNHVEWCLNKAKKEIEECEKLGKRKKHRGLLKLEPNIEIAKKHVEKAKHDLKAINYLLKGNFSDVSASMVFYSMYHCFLAIAARFGSYARGEAKKHSDIDILVQPPKGIGFGFAGIQLELEEKLGRKVHLVTYRSIHPYIKKSILADEVKII